MQNLVPHFILEKHALGESGGQFQAASLFADISGFSAATHALMDHGNEAAEAMAEIMLALFEPLVEQVHGQGGFITTFAGDAFTALFPPEDGAPSKHNYQRALAAAAAIQQHMIAHPVQTTAYGSFPFAIKLGLGGGNVEWGILRPERDETGPGAQNAVYFFSGPAVESAAAAEHQAQSGTLILSPSVYAQVQEAVKALPLADGHWRCLGLQGELPVPSTHLHLQQAALPEAEAAFIPEAICQRDSAGDFRHVVSVFIQLQVIDTREELDIFIQAVFDLLGQFGGYLNRLDFGDKGCNLLLYWGMPTSHENDVQRALEFVLELGNHTPGSFRAGLTYHPMYAGLSGSAERGEYTCYGDGVNLAARLMAAAPWGSLWLDERLTGRARERFVTEYIDHLAFKGFAEKQPVYALLERRPAGEGFFAGRMVGRQAELAELSAFVQPLFASNAERRFAGLLVLVGEAGLGKSRLVYEFLTREEWPVAGAAQVFTCQADQILRRPLNPFQYWLQRYFDQSPTQSAERNKHSFSRKLDHLLATVSDAALGQELNRTRSCLGALVGLEWESSLYARLDPKGRYENTLQALKALLKAESQRQPVVLVLEDAHWLDDDSQLFVQQLGREIDAYPLALLATARPERPGTLFGTGYPYRQLDLAYLSTADLALLAEDHLGGPLAPELLELLARRSESNPFFAEQILLYLREQSRLICLDGRWSLAASSGGAPLPEQVRAIFIARLDRLAKQVQDVVQAAAILGREFEVRVLAQMLKADYEGAVPPDTLAGQIAAAEQETIWSALSQINYIFKHALLRDAAYEMQLKTRRRKLHRLAAEALEHIHAEDLASHAGEIAYHYEAAYRQGLKIVRSQAVHYLEDAGNWAAARYENLAGVDWFSRALAIIDGEEHRSEESIEQCIRLLLGCEAIYHLLGRREEQQSDLQALAELIRVRQLPAEQAELALRQARLANAIGNYDRAQTQARAAMVAAQAAGTLRLEVSAQHEWGLALWRQGNLPEAAEHIQLAQALAQADGRKELQATGLRILGLVAQDQGEFIMAHSYFEQSLAITREIGDRQGESLTLNNLGNCLLDQGNQTTAVQYYEQSLAIAREIGNRQGEGSALNNLGIVFNDLGDFTAARQYYQQSLAICQETGDRQGGGQALNNLGYATYCLGDFSAARKFYEQSLSISQDIGNRQGDSFAFNNLGEVAFSQHDFAAAQQYYEQSLAICQEISDRRNECVAFCNLGEVAFSRGDSAAARQRFEQALMISRELELAYFIAENLAWLAKIALEQGDLAAARAQVLEILPILESNPSLNGAEHPRRAQLNCGAVLLAVDDPRGQAILNDAHTRLQELAAKMNEDDRRMFLENIPENRELCALYAQLHNGEQAAQQQVVLEPSVTPAPAKVRAQSGLEELPQTETPQPPPTPPVLPIPITGLDKQALAAQVTALLEQAAQAQGVTLVLLGDVHIHIEKIELSGQPVEPKDDTQVPHKNGTG